VLLIVILSSPDCLPGDIPTRVFIGGNYELAPILRLLKAFVIQEGLIPIFVGDYSIPKGKTNEYSMRLLFQCSRAVFEATIDNGHLMEIQKVAGELYIKTLLVYMCYDENKSFPKNMSFMVKDVPLPMHGYKSKQGYRSFAELRMIISDFIRMTRPLVLPRGQPPLRLRSAQPGE
jgi:hypothetical protein